MVGARLRQLNPAVTVSTLSTPPVPERVVLLHGLLRTRSAMSRLATELQADYEVVNQTYPSRRHNIETLATLAIENGLANRQAGQKVHFVTHSLGGILVRQYLSQHQIEDLGHVVMIGPPNQGSEIVEAFQQNPMLAMLFNSLNGPAGKQLGSHPNSKPNTLGAVDFSLGVIAGNRRLDPILSNLLPTESDGKVTVKSSMVDGMQDHIVLPVDHTFMMRDKRVIRQVKYFLEKGCFLHND